MERKWHSRCKQPLPIRSLMHSRFSAPKIQLIREGGCARCASRHCHHRLLPPQHLEGWTPNRAATVRCPPFRVFFVAGGSVKVRLCAWGLNSRGSVLVRETGLFISAFGLAKGGAHFLTSLRGFTIDAVFASADSGCGLSRVRLWYPDPVCSGRQMGQQASAQTSRENKKHSL